MGNHHTIVHPSVLSYTFVKAALGFTQNTLGNLWKHDNLAVCYKTRVNFCLDDKYHFITLTTYLFVGCFEQQPGSHGFLFVVHFLGFSDILPHLEYILDWPVCFLSTYCHFEVLNVFYISTMVVNGTPDNDNRNECALKVIPKQCV